MPSAHAQTTARPPKTGKTSPSSIPAQPSAGTERKGPDFAVNSIELNGDTKGDRATLTATIIVQVLRSDEWLTVPLFLNEAVVRKSEYSFLGKRIGAKPPAKDTGQGAYRDSTQEAGYRWWFRGVGYHRLKLTIVVPVVKTVAQRRMRLSLPPNSAASTLLLKVPVAGLVNSQVTVDPKGADRRVRKSDKGHSEIDVTGLGSRLDLQWHSVIVKASSRPLLQSESAATINVTEDSVVLTAVQSIRALSGKFDEVQVTLPGGFQLLEVAGKFVQSHTAPDSNNRCVVRFSEMRNDVTEIKWTLERRLKTRVGRMTIDGFAVKDARVQTGDIAVLKVPGLRISKQADGNLAVRSIRSSEFAVPDLIRDQTLAAAFRFRKQPFRLNLETAPLQSHVTVEPNYSLSFSKKSVTLNARFLVNISEDGGLIDRFDIAWPDWKANGWTLQPLSASRIIERRTSRGAGAQAILSHRMFRRRNGGFAVEVTATRPVPAKGALDIALPRFVADVTQTASLEVVRSRNIEVLMSQDGRGLRPEEAQPLEVPLTAKYRLRSIVKPIAAEVTTHARDVRLASNVVLSPTPNGIRVRHELTYDVRYEPLSVFAIRVPNALADAVQYFTPQGQPIAGQSSDNALPGDKYRVVEFPELPKIGRNTIRAEYFIRFRQRMSRGDSKSVTLPIIQGIEANRSRTSLNVEENSPIAVTPEADHWRPRSFEGRSSWIAGLAPAVVNVELQYPSLPRSRQFAVSRALLRAVMHANGRVRYRAQLRLSRGTGEFVLNLPGAARVDAIWIGQRRIEAPVAGRIADGRVMYRMPVAAEGTLITVDYNDNANRAAGWLGTQSLIAPQFSPEVAVGETVWKVTMPASQHVSSHDDGVFAEYQWRLDGFRFTRHATATVAHEDAWIGAGDGPGWSEPSESNSYFFRQFGPPSRFSVGVMSTSAIVLFGTGVAWLIGFLLARYAAARSVFTFATLALMVSLAGLWYSQELSILLQPAIVGFALAAVCTAIERHFSRKTAAPISSSANPTEFVLNSRTSNSGSAERSFVVGSIEATNHHTAEQPPVTISSEVRRPV